jgi:hypothetical protein
MNLEKQIENTMADVQACDGHCRDNPFCPEHGAIEPFEGLIEHKVFLFLNGIMVGELHGTNQWSGNVRLTGASVTLAENDFLVLREFTGPDVNYETWRDA